MKNDFSKINTHLYSSLPPDSLYDSLLKRESELKEAKKHLQKRLINKNIGYIKVKNKGSYHQYYYLKDAFSDKPLYIKEKDRSFAHSLIQQEYDELALVEVLKELSSIRSMLNNYSPRKLINIFQKFGPIKQKIIVPLILSDHDYIKKWKEEDYAPLPFAEDDTSNFFTAEGERVRSKSEVMIADALSRHNIPYKYERPLTFPDGTGYRPDFVCLNVRQRKEFIWEHFGMMADETYNTGALRKIEKYEANNYFPGINFISTFESSKVPLSTRNIEKLICTYLL